MLCLSELSGFIVCGIFFWKIYGKISAENHNRKPLPIKTMGRGDLVSGLEWAGYTKQQASQSWSSLRGLNNAD